MNGKKEWAFSDYLPELKAGPPLATCSHRYEKTDKTDKNLTPIWRCRCGAVKVSM